MKKIVILVSLALVLGLVISCPNDTPTPADPTPTPADPTPVFNPVSGTDLEQGDEISITSARDGVRIYYTTDDSDYTGYNWIQYNPNEKPSIDFGSAESVTYKAIAVKDGMDNSSVVEAIYNKMEKLAIPVFEPETGSYIVEQTEISLTSIAGASMYYTTGTSEFDGENPVGNGWVKYDETAKPKVAFGSETRVNYKAIAVKAGMTDSDIATAQYYLKGSFDDLTSPTVGTMKAIRGGSFARDDDATGSGTDTIAITVSNFYLGETEVTQGQWEEVMGTTPSKFTGSANLPVERVSWYDAIAFCNALSREEGLIDEQVYYKDASFTTVITETNNTGAVYANWDANGYRLPTEAEWEYAAGGGSGTRTDYAGTGNGTEVGENPLSDYAVYGGSSAGVTSSAIVKEGRIANGLGLYDMSGNVAEWCWDWYASSDRIIRGGGWGSSWSELRVAKRGYNSPSRLYSSLGFRVARSVAP